MVNVLLVKCILFVIYFWLRAWFLHIKESREYYLYVWGIKYRCSGCSYRSKSEPNYNVSAFNIINEFENRPDNLHSLWSADFSSSYVSKKTDDVPVEPDKIRSCSVSASNIDDVKVNPDIIVLRNELGETRKRSQTYVICFHKVFKLKNQKNIIWNFYSYICPGRMRMNRNRTTRVKKMDMKRLKVWRWHFM